VNLREDPFVRKVNMFGKKDLPIDAAGGEAYNAIMILATQDAPLKERLSKAWLNELSKVEEGRLSLSFQKRLRYNARFFPGNKLAGDVLDGLSPDEAVTLAMHMAHFAFDLEAMK
jgi:hypothetical protein